MRHCINETVEVHTTHGENLAPLLVEAANLVQEHEGWARVLTEPQVDPDTDTFVYEVTVYLH